MPSSDFIAEIRCNNQIYTGWTSLSVKRNYGDNSVTAFQFSTTENTMASSGWSGLRLKPGDAVQIYLAGIKVLDGTITTRQTAVDEKSHDIVVSGMSKTFALVAGSMPLMQGSFHGYSFEQATRSALAGTGVGLVIRNPPPILEKPFRSLNIDPGESRFNFIDKLARMRGLFLTDDKDGNLVCDAGNSTGQAVADLAEGVNILRARAILDDQSAWSNYSMVGQGTDPNASGPPRAVSATATGGAGPAGRDRVVMAEHPGDAQDMQARLGLEVARSTWPVVQVNVVVVGWKRTKNALWDVVGSNVTVKSRSLFPNESGALTLGLQSVTFLQDSEGGTTTELELVKPEALTSLGHPGIQADPQGNIVDGPTAGPPKADAPDYLPGAGSGDAASSPIG